MGRAFPPRVGCPVPSVSAITGVLVSSCHVPDPPPPIFQFPIFDFPLPNPPGFVFGCYSPSMIVHHHSTGTGSFGAQIIYPRKTQTGQCEPAFLFTVSFPPTECPTISTSAKIKLTPSKSPKVSLTASQSASQCAFTFKLSIGLPRNCAKIMHSPSPSVGFTLDAIKPSFEASFSLVSSNSNETGCRYQFDANLTLPLPQMRSSIISSSLKCGASGDQSVDDNPVVLKFKVPTAIEKMTLMFDSSNNGVPLLSTSATVQPGRQVSIAFGSNRFSPDDIGVRAGCGTDDDRVEVVTGVIAQAHCVGDNEFLNIGVQYGLLSVRATDTLVSTLDCDQPSEDTPTECCDQITAVSAVDFYLAGAGDNCKYHLDVDFVCFTLPAVWMDALPPAGPVTLGNHSAFSAITSITLDDADQNPGTGDPCSTACNYHIQYQLTNFMLNIKSGSGSGGGASFTPSTKKSDAGAITCCTSYEFVTAINKFALEGGKLKLNYTIRELTLPLLTLVPMSDYTSWDPNTGFSAVTAISLDADESCTPCGQKLTVTTTTFTPTDTGVDCTARVVCETSCSGSTLTVQHRTFVFKKGLLTDCGSCA